MSIRERQLVTLAFASGQTSRAQLPRDAVYHLLRLSVLNGTFSTVQGASGTGPNLVPGFPFSLMRTVRVIRNGSDVVVSASGEQLALAHYYANNSHAFARLFTATSNVETLRTATVRGLTVPANPQGIGARIAAFAAPDAPNSTGVLSFDMQLDIMFQVDVDDDYYSTLLDARPLSDYVIEIDWALESAQIATAGTTNGASTAAFTMGVLSVDQDNVKMDVPYGTYKRSQISYSNIPFGSQNNQVLLPRGNLLFAIQMATRAYKAGSTANPIYDSSLLGSVELRVNTNFSLKKLNFDQIQKANIADNSGRQNAFDSSSGGPQGSAFLSLFNATQSLRESLPTYAFDTLDLQIATQAQSAASNGATSNNTNPVIDFLIHEVIPGVSVASDAPRGAQAGSIAATNAGIRR